MWYFTVLYRSEHGRLPDQGYVRLGLFQFWNYRRWQLHEPTSHDHRFWHLQDVQIYQLVLLDLRYYLRHLLSWRHELLELGLDLILRGLYWRLNR